MSMGNTLPSDAERIAFMHRVRAFRDSLSDREQSMLDALVLAAYWPSEGGQDVKGYRLLPWDSIWGEEQTALPFDNSTWATMLANRTFIP